MDGEKIVQRILVSVVRTILEPDEPDEPEETVCVRCGSLDWYVEIDGRPWCLRCLDRVQRG